jgi:transposase-like protein
MRARRNYAPEEKRRLLAAAFAPGAVVQRVAKEHGVNPSILYYWRHQQATADAAEAAKEAPPAPRPGSDAPRYVWEEPADVSAALRAQVAAAEDENKRLRSVVRLLLGE